MISFHISYFLHDVTEIQNSRSALLQAKEVAEEANNSKSAFLATMSHEVRTPINGITGMCSLLLDTELTREQQDYACTIRQSADGLLTIINDILDFSRLDSGRNDLKLIEFNLRALIEDTIQLLSSAIQQQNCDVFSIVNQDIPDLLCAVMLPASVKSS